MDSSKHLGHVPREFIALWFNLGFNKCTCYEVYMKDSSKQDYLIICLNVDDLLVTGFNEDEQENSMQAWRISLRCKPQEIRHTSQEWKF